MTRSERSLDTCRRQLRSVEEGSVRVRYTNMTPGFSFFSRHRLRPTTEHIRGRAPSFETNRVASSRDFRLRANQYVSHSFDLEKQSRRNSSYSQYEYFRYTNMYLLSKALNNEINLHRNQFRPQNKLSIRSPTALGRQTAWGSCQQCAALDGPSQDA